MKCCGSITVFENHHRNPADRMESLTLQFCVREIENMDEHKDVFEGFFIRQSLKEF